MPTIQIRDVPEEVHAVYRRRAAAAGLSLQEYLRQELAANARLASPAEIAAEVERERELRDGEGFSSSPAARWIREDRESR